MLVISIKMHYHLCSPYIYPLYAIWIMVAVEYNVIAETFLTNML